MAPDTLIGVDLGTSVVKTTLFDTAGRSLADATRTAALSQPAPGFAEQRGEDFYAATLATIREVVDKTGTPPAAVAAIAFAGQMAGAIGIDRDWNALTPWYPSALDNRYNPILHRCRNVWATGWWRSTARCLSWRRACCGGRISTLTSIGVSTRS